MSAAPPSAYSAEPYDRCSLKALCWGLLFHMQGLVGHSKERFEEIGNTQDDRDPLRKVAASVSKHQEAPGPPERAEAHRDVIRALGEILHPQGHGTKGPRLNLECPRSSRYRRAKDSPKKGYSRDPFKRIAPKIKPEIGLAAISYVMRAHSLFFHRPRGERSFNAAKVALNDLFQASQLACRLYYSLPECHTRKGSQEEYIAAVSRGADPEKEPWCSPFFVWSVLNLVEIQRGNIYRQLRVWEEADRHYRQVQVRFQRLVRDPLELAGDRIISLPENHSSADVWFITPTFVRTLSERAKVLFDRGLFIDSMMCQLHCLAFLVRMSSASHPLSKKKKGALAGISQGLRLLDITRKESVWDKESIHALFTKVRSGAKPPLGVLLTRDFFSFFSKLPETERELVADLFTRIALTLFVFRSESQIQALPTLTARTLDERAAQDGKHVLLLMKLIDSYKKLEVPPPAIALDAKGIVLDNGEQRDQSWSPASRTMDSLERRLARSLREAIRGPKPTAKPLDDEGFYEAVLRVATQNILNIVTIPRRIQAFMLRPGYKERRRDGDLSGKTVADPVESHAADETKSGKIRDKLVILRRWQSFNPKIPRPQGDTVRGGGYFLLWGGKGIVIDPGYHFLQNFYDEGFSIGDIDAVVITHSHPDHEDDLSTLSTLVLEWNEYYQHMGRGDNAVRLDLLLNESAHLKFANWLKASHFGIGRIIPLPLVVWNLDSEDPTEARRGTNVILNLRQTYHFDLEVVPAWHDDVIGKTAAVGLKFHLYSDGGENRKVGVVGYTSDTGAYPWPESGNEEKCRSGRVEDHYAECDVLVAHLGDVRLRELFSAIDLGAGARLPLGPRIGKLLSDALCEGGKASKTLLASETGKVEDFFSLLVTLKIAPRKALEAIIDPDQNPPLTVARALNDYIRSKHCGKEFSWQGFSSYKEIKEKLEGCYNDMRISSPFEEHLGETVPSRAPSARMDTELEDWQIAYALLGFLSAASLSPWRYDYHLGITGLYRMQRALLKDHGEREKRGDPGRGRILVVGELPEELASYRHHVTRLLNFTEGNFDQDGTRRVHAFTGDIGLHISLETESSGPAPALQPKIRCSYCNYNNETVLELRNYHPPAKVRETPLKRLNSAMIYLCTTHDHHPEAEEKPHDFLSRPSLRVI